MKVHELIKETVKDTTLFTTSTLLYTYKNYFDTATSFFAMVAAFAAMVIGVIRVIRFIRYKQNNKDNAPNPD